MATPREREPDTYPRWALVVDAGNNIRPVLLAVLERELAKGMGRYVIAREDVEMFVHIDEGGD